ncbi:hypothetical protein GE061_011826 [Apolygus lucorum]|uniref:Uncharacterized protein n=1 Tax=Apolygus lucorum TaxID=248454 RepID=A0A8S9Y2P3_APOLU|nr:hypothetical protein GE061_011826 [Apolygus lucorum]
MASQRHRHQKRISDDTDDSREDIGDDLVDDKLDAKSAKKFTERKVVIQAREPGEDELESDSGSTSSDIRDVLNCIRDLRDIKHATSHRHVTCGHLRKEEAKVYQTAQFSEEDHENYPFGDISYGDYELMGAKPVRIPIVHVKDCVHEKEWGDNSKVQREPQNTSKWCFCEDQGSSDEEPCYEYQPFDEFMGTNDVGLLKLLPPKLAPVNETGTIDWKNVQQDSDLQDVLNCMFPPKVYTVNGQVWIQEVSPEAARRTEVVKLVEVLEMKIEEQQIKSKGQDPVRRSLYAQLFDELIRQETVVSPETGLLLLRIRDELRMTCDAWESILSQAHNYGVQNITKCGSRMKPLQTEVEKLIQELVSAEQELAEFWAEQYLIKSEEHLKRENVLEDRKVELAPHQARNKLYKEQIRLLVNREEDNIMQQSHLS